MNTHLDDGILRAYLDGELGDAQAQQEAQEHLGACPDCRSRLADLQAQAERAAGRLAFLTPSSAAASTGPQLEARPAFARFKNRLNQKKEIPMLQKFLRPRTYAVGLVVVLLLVVALSIPSGFAWAGQFLNLFRVQQVAVIPIDPTGLMALRGNSSLGQQISQVLAQSISFSQKPGASQEVASAAQASQAAGFTVRLPDNQNLQPRLVVQPGAAFDLTVDRARAQALLDESGHSDLVLPQSIDKETISVTIPNSVSAAYGVCPDLTGENSSGASLMGSNGRRYADCVILAQIPSPTVNAPPDLDVQKLAQLALQFTGMSADQAQAFAQSVNWTSSLVLPLPKNAATYQQVTVDGVSGYLIQRPPDDAPEFALIWVKNGVIYTIGGLGSNSAQAITMANSMK
jgi:anti-sigma factor RsiW